MLALMMATLVFGHDTPLRTEAMAHIKEEAGFNPKEPPKHQTDIKVGLHLEHLLDVSTSALAAPATPAAPATSIWRTLFCTLRTFRSLRTQRYLRGCSRILTLLSTGPIFTLSALPPHAQVSIPKHTLDMDFYLTEEWKDGRNYSALFSDENLVELEPDSCEEQRTARAARILLSTKASARDIDGQEQRVRRLAEIEADFNPGKGDVVKYFNEHSGSTYTARIESLSTDEAGKVIYNIVYTDESGFVDGMKRPTYLASLSSMPQPARRFVEFGHDELKLIWEPDVHITNLHQDMLVHEEVPAPSYLYSPPCPLPTSPCKQSPRREL